MRWKRPEAGLDETQPPPQARHRRHWAPLVWLFCLCLPWRIAGKEGKKRSRQKKRKDAEDRPESGAMSVVETRGVRRAWATWGVVEEGKAEAEACTLGFRHYLLHFPGLDDDDTASGR